MQLKNTRTFTSEETAKLKKFMEEAKKTLLEVEDLNIGLTDTCKSIGAELDVKPGLLKKAAKVALKASYEESEDELDLLHTILATTNEL